SKADDEYDECLLKGAFVDALPVSGAPAVVRVPPAAQRDFELIETVLVDNGGWQQLTEHLDRMGESAQYFGFKWDRHAVEAAVRKEPAPFGLSRGRIRLLPGGRIAIEVMPFAPFGAPRRVALSQAPVDASDPFLCHKTTRREVYTTRAAERPDCDDVVLVNERGEVTESTIANVVVRIGGALWTPPREAGLLAGVFRRHLLETGEIRERTLRPADLAAADEIWLVNSVRRWRRAVLVP
ncbi:MAG: aminotransferase class IV, partial [Longimicrobiaceae bacterium]